MSEMLLLSDYIAMSRSKVVALINSELTNLRDQVDSEMQTLTSNTQSNLNTLSTQLTQHQNENTFSHGSSNFSGLGSETSIAHSLGVVPSYVSVVPNNATNGYLGEIWVRKDENNIYVGNTGSHTGAFNWLVRK